MGTNAQYGKGGQTPPGYNLGTLAGAQQGYMNQAAAQPMTGGKGGGKGGSTPAGYSRALQQGPVSGGSWQPGFYGQNTDYFGQPGTASANYQYNTQQAPGFVYPNAPQYAGAPGDMWWQSNQGHGVYVPAAGQLPPVNTSPTSTPAPGVPAPGAPPSAATPVQDRGPGDKYYDYIHGLMNPGAAATTTPTTTATATATPTGHATTTPVSTTTTGHSLTNPPTAPTGGLIRGVTDLNKTTPNIFPSPSVGHGTPAAPPSWTPEPPGTSAPTPPSDYTPSEKTQWTVEQARANGITDGTVLSLIGSGYLDANGKLTSTANAEALNQYTPRNEVPGRIIDALNPPTNVVVDPWGGSGQLSPVQQAQKNGITDGTILNMIAAGYLNPDGSPK